MSALDIFDFDIDGDDVMLLDMECKRCRNLQVCAIERALGNDKVCMYFKCDWTRCTKQWSMICSPETAERIKEARHRDSPAPAGTATASTTPPSAEQTLECPSVTQGADYEPTTANWLAEYKFDDPDELARELLAAFDAESGPMRPRGNP